MDNKEYDEEFYKMINSEDWDLGVDDVMTELPVGELLLPSPIPGVWLKLYLGFNIENPGFNIEEPGEYYG